MSETYESILDRQWGDVPKPVVLPDGSWLLKGENVVHMPPKESGDQRVLFFYTPKEPMDDVDADAIEALGEDYDYGSNQVVYTIWLRHNNWEPVRQHLALHGVDIGDNTTQKESFKAFKGTEIVAYLTTKTFTDSNGVIRVENDPTNFAVVE